MTEAAASPAFVALVQATAGATGGVFASAVLQPLEVAKTRIQISQAGTTSMLGILSEVFSAEGVVGLFRGVNTKCVETGSKNFVFFYIYDAINAAAKRRTPLTTGMKLVLGYIAGVGTTCLTMPLELLATRAAADTSGKGIFAMLASILETDGLSGLFKGFGFNILLCVNPAIQNTCFDKLKARVLKASAAKAMTPLQGFVLGAVAKAIATLLTFPLVRLKTMLQAGKPPPVVQEPPRAAEEEGHLTRAPSTSQLLGGMSRRLDLKPSEQGLLQRFFQLYRGLGSALWKSTLQASLLYMTKDQVEQLVVWLFKLSAEMLRRRNGRLKLGAWSGRPLAS
jgi:adenine nucleotide transporter 17